MKTYAVGAAPPFYASKWLHVQLLVSVDEMQHLLHDLGDAFLFSTLGIAERTQFSKEEFIRSYASYVDALVQGSVCDEDHRFHFTCVITREKNAVAQIHLPDGRHLIQPVRPLLQMRPHRLDYSPIDGVFRPMVLGQKTISWGVQISYPQLYQDAETRTVHNALEEPFENLPLYRALQAFVRRETLPAPFVVNGAKIVVPMRLGKECFSWINGHKELIVQQIQVLQR